MICKNGTRSIGSHEVILRVRVQETTERDRLRFAFNGKELPQSLLRKINQM